MQPTLETPEIAGLLAETRAGLAHLRADELEALAKRAEEMLARCEGLVQEAPHMFARRGAPQLQAVGRERRLLGDLLEATGENLRVLRRAHGSADGSSRWAR